MAGPSASWNAMPVDLKSPSIQIRKTFESTFVWCGVHMTDSGTHSRVYVSCVTVTVTRNKFFWDLQ